VPFFSVLLEESTVHATVHIDVDEDGIFDYEPPDGFIDVPAERASGDVATAAAEVRLLAPLAPASIELDEQTSDGRVVVVGTVDLPSSGFVVIQSDNDGEPGTVLGVSAMLPAGESTNVEVRLDPWLRDDEDLWAVVWIDRDRDGLATIDVEDTLDGMALTADNEFAFTHLPIDVRAIYPVTIGVDDQEGDGTNVNIALVTMPSGGFVELLSDVDGEPGARIGFSGLVPTGTSTDLEIELNEPLDEDGTIWVRVFIDYDGDRELSAGDLLGFITQEEEALVSLAFTFSEEDGGS